MTTLALPERLRGTGRTARMVSNRRNGTSLAVGLILISLASVQFGAGMAVRLFPQVGPSGATSLRLTLGAVVLLALTRPAVRSFTRPQWIAVGLLGLSLGAMNETFYHAIARIPLGPAVTIEFLGPLVLAAAISRRLRDGAWALLAFTGILLLQAGNLGGAQMNLTGGLLALLAGGFWAAYILAGSRTMATGVGLGGLAVAMVIAALVTLPAGIASAGPAVLHPHLLLMGLLIAIFSSVIPYSCELAALARMPKRVFSVLLALEPAGAAVVGALLLHQSLTLLALAGIATVVCAGVGSTLSASEPRGARQGRRRTSRQRR